MVAELLVLTVPYVLPLAKILLTRLSLLYFSYSPPSLQAPGEVPLNNIDENFIFVVAHATSASTMNFLGLVIGIHGAIMIIIQLFPTGLILQANT